MRCYKCGNTFAVPADAPEEVFAAPAPLAQASAGSAEVYGVAADRPAANRSVAGAAARPVAPAAFSGTFGSRMRQELRVLKEDNGWAEFASTHKLMLGVIGLAVGSFLARLISGSLELGFLMMLAGLAVALCTFLPRSPQREFYAAKITMRGSLVAVLVTAVWLLVSSSSVVLAFEPVSALLVIGILVGAVAAIGLVSTICNAFRRFGVYLVLGWCYLLIIGVLPAGWSLVSTSSIPDSMSTLWQAVAEMGTANSASDEQEQLAVQGPRTGNPAMSDIETQAEQQQTPPPVTVVVQPPPATFVSEGFTHAADDKGVVSPEPAAQPAADQNKAPEDPASIAQNPDHPDCLRQNLVFLSATDPQQRQAALERLAHWNMSRGPTVGLKNEVARAMRACAVDRHDSSENRVRAIQGMVAWDAETSVPTLCDLLKTNDSSVRQAALRALKENKRSLGADKERAIQAAAEMFATHREDRQAAGNFLRGFGSDAEDVVLMHLRTSTTNPETTRAIIALLGHIGTKKKSLEYFAKMRIKNGAAEYADDIRTAGKAITARSKK